MFESVRKVFEVTLPISHRFQWWARIGSTVPRRIGIYEDEFQVEAIRDVASPPGMRCCNIKEEKLKRNKPKNGNRNMRTNNKRPS